MGSDQGLSLAVIGGHSDTLPPVDDISPFSEDIDPLLAIIQNPESVPLAFQAVHNYRVRMQDLLEAAKCAKAGASPSSTRLHRRSPAKGSFNSRDS